MQSYPTTDDDDDGDDDDDDDGGGGDDSHLTPTHGCNRPVSSTATLHHQTAAPTTVWTGKRRIESESARRKRAADDDYDSTHRTTKHRQPVTKAAVSRTSSSRLRCGRRTGAVDLPGLNIDSHTHTSLSGRLHVPIVGPTGRSDWSVRLVGPTIVSCKRFVRLVGQTIGTCKHPVNASSDRSDRWSDEIKHV